MATLLREADVSALLTMDDALVLVEEAFRSASKGQAVNIARCRGALGGATMNVLGAISLATDTMAMKVYPIVRHDVTVGSSVQVLVYRVSSGALIGILEAHALGQIRTGAASGIATRYLARSDSRVMTLFGAGWQARAQLEAISRVLPALARVNVLGRSPERVRQFCAEMSQRLALELFASSDPQKAVSDADVVTTATGATRPVFDGHWLRPGVHINAVGSNFAQKQELDAAAIRRADRIVADDVAVARLECGDLLSPEAAAEIDWDSIHGLGDVVGGVVPGRQSQDEITLFESQGLGLEDLAVASHVLSLAEQRGIGTQLPIR